MLFRSPPSRCCAPRWSRATTRGRYVPPSVFPSPPWSRDRAASLVREREQNRSFQATARQAFDHEGAHAPASPSISPAARSEEHTSEHQSLMRILYAVFCLKKRKFMMLYHIRQRKLLNSRNSYASH